MYLDTFSENEFSPLFVLWYFFSFQTYKIEQNKPFVYTFALLFYFFFVSFAYGTDDEIAKYISENEKRKRKTRIWWNQGPNEQEQKKNEKGLFAMLAADEWENLNLSQSHPFTSAYKRRGKKLKCLLALSSFEQARECAWDIYTKREMKEELLRLPVGKVKKVIG